MGGAVGGRWLALWDPTGAGGPGDRPVRVVARAGAPDGKCAGTAATVGGRGGNGYAETARDQSGAVPVTRHRARYSGIGGVYGTVPSGRWMSRAGPVTRAPTA